MASPGELKKLWLIIARHAVDAGADEIEQSGTRRCCR